MAGHKLICWWPLILLIIIITQDLSKRRELFVRALVEGLGISATELIRLRGFYAEDHYFTTSDGYILNIIKATNPLINEGRNGLENKSVIIAVHGTITNAKCFIVYSSGAHPADYSKYDAGSMTEEELLRLTANNNARYSIVFTALNFGHEVWLLNKRGTQYSQGHIDPNKKPYLKLTNDNNYSNSFNVTKSEELLWNLNDEEQELKKKSKLNVNNLNVNFEKSIEFDKNARSISPKLISNMIKILLRPNFALSGLANTFNPDYWNFSLDEQAIIDIPEAVDFVRRKTGRDKLIYIGHSSGAALGLMALSVNRTLNDKLSKTILWAPALHTGQTTTKLSLWKRAGPMLSVPLMVYVAGVSPTIIVPLIQKMLALACNDDFGLNVVCKVFFDTMFGPGSIQQTWGAGVFSALFDSVSSHEFAQLGQFIKTVKSYRFDFGSVSKNIEAYGQPTPPVYDLSTITNKGLSYWYSSADSLVEIENIKLQLSDIKVPVEKHFLNMPGVLINHASYFLHKWVDKLVIIPTMQTIESH